MYSRRGPGVPLMERGTNHHLSPVSPPSASPPSRPRRRHAWARLRPGAPEVEALVISWRSTPEGWVAMVVCAVDDDQAMTVVLPATLLRPAD